jgi:predicted RNA binding protein YcfA (HicA-like mRNA interferase family)
MRPGYVMKPCTGGSHINFIRADGKGFIITVPYPKSRELRKGTVKQMIRFLSANESISEDAIIEIIKEM